MKKLFLLVLIFLASACFSKNSFASTYDDFNDGVIDRNKWSFINEDLQFFSENSGTFNIDWNGLPPAKQDPFIRSKAWFGGNFDVSVKYENLSIDKVYSSANNNSTVLDLQLQDRSVPMNPPTHSYIYRGWSPSSDDVYYSSLFKNGVWQGENASHQTNDTSGYLRITRTGSTIDTYHADSSKQWVHLDTYNNAFTGPADITLFSVMEDNVDSFHVKLDNVQVMADKIIPPQATPPTLPPTEPIRENNATSGLKNLINPSGNPDPNKPSIILVHGRQGSSQDWPTEMSALLKERFKEQLKENTYNILAWDWKDAANYPTYIGQDLKNLYSNAIMQGDKLAVELINRNLLNKDLHLVGHSAGGALIDETAKAVKGLGFDKVEHLTFLDPLDPADTLDGKNAIWADNYYSALKEFTLYPEINGIGSPVRNTYYRDLGTPYGLNFTENHKYPIKWYESTIKSTGVEEGFFWSKEGDGWNEKPLPQPSTGRNIITTKLRETFDSIGNWLGSGYVYMSNGMAFLKESSPAYLFEDISIPADTNYLNFDFRFIELGDGDLLKFYFDDQFLFAYEGSYFLGNDFINSGMIDISQFAGRNGRLMFALENYGDPNSEIAIDNLQFYQVSPVPEPSTLALLLTGLFATFGLKRRSKK